MNPVIMSATDAKVKFGGVLNKVKAGTPVIVEKNKEPMIVCISIDDYEDFLEINDKTFQNSIKKGAEEIKNKEFGTLDDLYEIHRKTIAKEARKK